MESSSNVISSVIPLYYVLRIVGLSPFCPRGGDSGAARKKVWPYILAIVLSSVLLFRLARLLLWEIHLAGSSVQWVPTALHLLLTYSTTITSLLIASTTKFRCKVQHIFSIAKSLDDDLQHHFEGSAWQTLLQLIIVSLVLLPFSVITIIIWEELWPPGLTLCDIWCFLTNTLLVMQFVNVVCIFQACNATFNKHILSQPWRNKHHKTFKDKKLTSIKEVVSKISGLKNCMESQKPNVETEECELSGWMKVTYTIQSETVEDKSSYNLTDIGCFPFSPSTFIQCLSCNEHVTTQILKLRSFHLKLYDLANVINEAFGFQILLSLASFFNFALVALNFTIDLVGRMVQNNGSTSNGYYVSVNQEAITIFWGLWAASCITVITVNCHRAALEADNSSVVMHKATLIAVQQQTEAKLNTLLLQLTTIKIKFVAAGFFVMDLSLLHAIVAVMCTYLIVIFQFRS